MTKNGTTAGLIGLGLMGEPISASLLAAGVELTCFDLDPGALDRVAQQGAAVAENAAEVAATSDVVLVIVPTADDVRTVCLGEGGVFAAAGEGTVVAVLSSLRPDTCRELARDAEPFGVEVIDAPMTGGIRAAEAATMTLLVGGSSNAVERARPVLTPISGQIHHLGEIGAGQVGKIVNNLIHWGEVVVITQALSFAAALGIKVSTLREALTQGPTDSRHLRELGLMKFTWHAKDLADALELAEDLALELPVAGFSQEQMLAITPERVAELLEDRGWQLPERA